MYASEGLSNLEVMRAALNAIQTLQNRALLGDKQAVSYLNSVMDDIEPYDGFFYGRSKR